MYTSVTGAWQLPPLLQALTFLLQNLKNDVVVEVPSMKLQKNLTTPSQSGVRMAYQPAHQWISTDLPYAKTLHRACLRVFEVLGFAKAHVWVMEARIRETHAKVAALKKLISFFSRIFTHDRSYSKEKNVRKRKLSTWLVTAPSYCGSRVAYLTVIDGGYILLLVPGWRVTVS
jgi:hypothetical protein